MDAFKLPFEFDPVRLADDARRLEGLIRYPQPGPHHKGEWTGIAIHSAGGIQSAAPGFPSLDPFAFTAEADCAPYLKEILRTLPFPLHVVRVLGLPPGGVIGTHFDFDTTFQFGLIRTHIPLQTNPDVEFLIAGRRYDMRVGEFWYGDFSKPHHVTNRGTRVRLHAVADIEVNDELLALIPTQYLLDQSQLGPISRHRPPLDRTDDLPSFECRFFVPGTVLPLLVMGNLKDLVAGASAEVRCAGGELILLLNDTRRCKLVRVGLEDFVFLGFPPGCFLRLDRTNSSVPSPTLMVRGVQEDLVSARVGIVRGNRIAEREIPLKLV
ncbi:MAG TPA: aspartyl/asparaginyl beta-hydroxylase domain-containing protein [Vicinamibacterales bacterium]|nr:aspartyl/asparaginyl beta-hydroxylase domain-containing protein [Vicinamibacterales bacterium]